MREPKSNVTLAEIVRAQVALLFSKWRGGALSDEEKAAMQADRAEWSQRLTMYLRAIDAPERAVIEQVRKVTRELYRDANPNKIPSIEEVAARVKGAFQVQREVACEGCRDMGGYYLHASDDEPLYSREPGTHPWGLDRSLCTFHHEAANWYAWRAGWWAQGKPWPYPAPLILLPRGARHDRDWSQHTDGALMGRMARWAVAYVERQYPMLQEIVRPPGQYHAPEPAPVPAAPPDPTETDGPAWSDV